MSKKYKYLIILRLYSYVAKSGVSSKFPVPLFSNARAHIADGIAYADGLYQNQTSEKATAVLFIVQPNERNIFDQRLIEYELLQQ